MAIGIVALDTGEEVLGSLWGPATIIGAPDITRTGSWTRSPPRTSWTVLWTVGIASQDPAAPDGWLRVVDRSISAAWTTQS